MSSDIEHRHVPSAAKWSVRQIRSGPAGDVVWVFGLLGFTGTILKEFEITRSSGEALDALQPGALLKKMFACGTQKQLVKH